MIRQHAVMNHAIQDKVKDTVTRLLTVKLQPKFTDKGIDKRVGIGIITGAGLSPQGANICTQTNTRQD
ncbi:MAG: hypothetical protein LPD71_10640 [Shewanella sp.]|nr:hypothetical protein [Shewanella sp.]MCF1429361.1 hypothetical protein [Shewanella sp.]MCF1439174.1 hypothetical protein [Shewanella sp.]MCF1456067.1 hypothetical protein [Shewanella sp.]